MQGYETFLKLAREDADMLLNIPKFGNYNRHKHFNSAPANEKTLLQHFHNVGRLVVLTLSVC